MAHDIFISYRRNGGFETAHYLYEHLVRDGYGVTFDIDALRSGRFDEELLARIDECTDFIVILSPGCFDRTVNPAFPKENDWLRRELAHALANGKNVVPIMLRDFAGFPPNLPEDVEKVQWMNGPEYSHQYIDDFYERLKQRFLRSKPTRSGTQPVAAPPPADPLAAAGIPALGKPVPELERTGLSGDDAKHFSAAMGHLRVLRYRSAQRELRAIRDREDPVARFHEALLAFELDGEGDESALEAACIAARDRGSTAAMIAYANYHLNEIDAVPNGECIAWLKKALELGDADAYLHLAVAFENGRGVEKNPELAGLLRQRVYNAGSLEARMYLCVLAAGDSRQAKDQVETAKMFRPLLTHLEGIGEEADSSGLLLLGFCWATGSVFERDARRGAQYLEKVIQSKGRIWDSDGSIVKAMAYFLLGMLYLGGEDFEKDEKKAVDCFTRARELHDPDGGAICALAQCYENGIGVDEDAEKAMELYKEAANRGNAEAQRHLALECFAYFEDGPKQDVPRGRLLLMQAAESGDSDAQFFLGSALVCGEHFVRDVPAGLSWLEKAAESGSGHAMNALGLLYRDGTDGLEADPEKGVYWFRRGAEAGNGDAMENLGLACLAGDGISRDVNEARRWLERAVEQGNASAECSLGTRFSNGDFGQKDWDEAVKWWEKAAEHGDATAMGNLGRFYKGGLTPDCAPDLEKAENWLVKAAESGDAEEMCALGACFHRGDFGTPDFQAAFGWFQKAAGLGDANAMDWLGMMYRDGDGVEKNIDMAIQWFQRAAEAGNSDAMGCLGLLYLNGNGVPQDDAKAEEWLRKAFDAGELTMGVVLGNLLASNPDDAESVKKAADCWRKAAEGGDAWGMLALSHAYRDGEGVERNAREAVKWLRRSAEAGDDDAMEELGVAYLQGEGVPIDEDKAREWLERAAEKGNASAECSLGTRFAHGDFGEEDMDEAVKWWEKAAEHGDAVAWNNLGIVFSDGSMPVDLDKARECFRKAEELGNEDACYHIALDILGLLETGEPDSFEAWVENPVPGASNERQALRRLRKARSWFGHPLELETDDAELAGDCNLWLARIARFEDDLEEAKALYAKAAELGNGIAAEELRAMTEA